MTNPMTPGQARVVLDAAEGATDYTWADAHHALETIAGMREEWGVEDRWGYVKWFPLIDPSDDSRRRAEECAAGDDDYYLVRRYVTQHEVIDGE